MVRFYEARRFIALYQPRRVESLELAQSPRRDVQLPDRFPVGPKKDNPNLLCGLSSRVEGCGSERCGGYHSKYCGMFSFHVFLFC